jgi:hypothetical protein
VKKHTDPGDQIVRSPPPAPRCPETLDMFEPPTGPKAKAYTREEGQVAAYYRWRDTDEGVEFVGAMTRAAFAALYVKGRFSTRTFLCMYRDEHKLRINNNFSPWLADELVATHPELLDVVERRKRKGTA